MALNKRMLGVLALAGLVALVSSRPQDYDEDEDHDHDHDHDQNHAASHHEHGGRVQIKVYRGPTDHDGHQAFAPWGFWVKQPADDGH